MSINIETILEKLYEKHEEIRKDISEQYLAISKDINDIKVILATQKEILAQHDENLEIHMKRSDANEALINITREELKPLQKDSHYIHAGLKIFGLASIGISMIVGLIEIISFMTQHLPH